jgi:hypothetical protein
MMRRDMGFQRMIFVRIIKSAAPNAAPTHSAELSSALWVGHSDTVSRKCYVNPQMVSNCLGLHWG